MILGIDLEPLKAQLLGSLQNQFLAGGIGLMALGALGMMLRQVPRKLWALFIHHCTVVMDVQSTDPAYDWLLAWLEEQPYAQRTRRISIKHITLQNGARKASLVPARGNHWFVHKGAILWLTRAEGAGGTAGGGSTTPEPVSSAGSAASMFASLRETISVRVMGRSRARINALITEARTVYERPVKDEMLTVRQAKWGTWDSCKKPKRAFESLMLPDGAETVLPDMQQFLTHETWYRQMGIPYRRGYLFSGPPGTGKSSMAEVLAGTLDIPLYVLNLASRTDEAVESLMQSIRQDKAAMLLIEDIDTVRLERAASAEDQKLSIGTLLNMLDGVAALDNLILVMTSNHPEALDPALIRAGRIDIKVSFGMATDTQIQQAIRKFLPRHDSQARQAILQAMPRPISMADVQERLRQMALDAGV